MSHTTMITGPERRRRWRLDEKLAILKAAFAPGAAVSEVARRRELSRGLPVEPYVYAEWKIRRVGIDYRIDLDGHYYPAPHHYMRSQVEVRIAARSVEMFFKGERIAAHIRQATCGKHTTLTEHMPKTHRTYANWTLEGITGASGKPGAVQTPRRRHPARTKR
jgi:transposase